MSFRLAVALAALLVVGVFAAVPGARDPQVRFPALVQVHQARLPAGEYAIRTVDNGGGSPLPAIEAEDGSAVWTTVRREPRRTNSSNSRPAAVCRTRDGRLQLAEGSFAGQDFSYAIVE